MGAAKFGIKVIYIKVSREECGKVDGEELRGWNSALEVVTQGELDNADERRLYRRNVT